MPEPLLLGALVVGAVGLLVAVPVYHVTAVVAALVVYHVAVAGAAALDLGRLPRRRGWEAARTLPRPLSLGADQEVRVRVAHADAAGLRAVVADHAPAGLDPGPREVWGTFDAEGNLTIAYRVRPTRRGAYPFGEVELRCRRARFPLWSRQVRIPAAESVAVYPNVLAIREYELRLRRGLRAMAGLRRAQPPGAATAWAGLRDYVRGDDVRRISWKATARRDRPVSTVVEAERGQQMVIAIDCARLMTAPAGRLTKLDHAVNAALLLAWVSEGHGDRVGMLTFSDAVLGYAEPQRGAGQLARLNHMLYAVQASYSEPDFGEALAFLSARLNRRSLVVLLTDVLDPEASGELVDHALRLGSRHLVLVVAMGDPEVLAARDRPLESSARVYEWAAAEELLAARRRAFEVLRRGGVLGLDVTAGELSPALVERYLDLKERALL